jgi:nitrogen fixation protein NifB
MDASPTSRGALPAPGSSGLPLSRIVLPACAAPLVLRRDQPPPQPSVVLDAGDALRYAGAARRVLRGPLVAVFDGPGDPLASAGTVLRALALLKEHDPDVLTGLVVDGPLVAEYVDELVDLGVRHVVVRMDAATLRTARRVVGRVLFRGDVLSGVDAARLVLEEGRRAVRRLVDAGIPVGIRFTAIPTVNLGDVASVASFAARAGAGRMDVVPHVPKEGAPLAKAGTPTRGELSDAATLVERAFRDAADAGLGAPASALTWLLGPRVRDVPLSRLDRVDPLALLPDPDETPPEPGEILPPRRARLVAVATTDGRFVDRSFADAGQLRLYAVGRERNRFLGTRPLPPEPARRRDGVGSSRGLLLAIAGCHAVVSTRFSARATTLLSAVGIEPVTAGGHLDEVLDRVSRGTLRSRRPARDLDGEDRADA